MDPRVQVWTEVREIATQALAAKHQSLRPHLKLFAQGLFATGSSKPKTWKELVEWRAMQSAQFKAALQNVGAEAEWDRICGFGYDEAIKALSPGLEIAEYSARGINGNAIPLQVIRPSGAGPVPLVFYVHGGGMAIMSSRNGNFQSFARLIARQGVAVALVEFRNSLDATTLVAAVGQFPAGLDDCYAALQWVNANRALLRVSSLIVAGESGGANLSIAMALKAKRQSELGLMGSGIFAMCPYIAGEWTKEVNHGILGTSHIENGPAVFSAAMMYGQEAFDRRDPLAWPGFATVEDLMGLPPIIISVNEFDIFRDEGINFYRRCLLAKVPAQCRMVLGTAHANDMHFHMMPELATSTARAIADFAANGSVLESRMSMPAPVPTPMVSRL
eukprot:TRINITY_DN57265_c0_g1_i1.p1 TRINITY_DN57265_c0_g1~~TRINITY_DN57265_c0_g1_i1.p1  ORF type:complete len:389 (-),score=60.35 TRINITY_DN57265_c0_g1_i1:197-1363(-)